MGETEVAQAGGGKGLSSTSALTLQVRFTTKQEE